MAKKKTKKKTTKKKVAKKVSKKKTKKKATKKKVAKKASKKKTKKKATKKKVAKKASKKKTKKKATKKKVAKRKPSEGRPKNDESKKLKIPLNYSINNSEGFSGDGNDEESTKRAEWLGVLKSKNQELLNMLTDWSDAYDRQDIGHDSWALKESSGSDEKSEGSSPRLLKPEQISEYIESNIIKWIKEPSDPTISYNYTLEDFQKVYEKICHINSENTTPMGFSSDVRHLSRFLEIVDNNIKSMLEKNN